MVNLDPVTRSIIASCALASLVLPSFIFRLWIRIRIQRVGWDDIWAGVAFVCGILNVVSDWIYIIEFGIGESSMISMMIYIFSFKGLVWAVRISIIFSIIRIIPVNERLHKYGLAIVAIFLLICLGLVVQEAVYCTSVLYSFQATASNAHFHCALPRATNIAELTVGCVASAISVGFPLYVLRRATLPPKRHRLLRLLFSSSLVVSIACTLRAVFQLVPQLSHWSFVITNFQIAICLVVSDIVVVATYLYRVLGSQSHNSVHRATEKTDSALENDDLTTPSSMPGHMTLTTVELLVLGDSGESASFAMDETVSKSVSTSGASC